MYKIDAHNHPDYHGYNLKKHLENMDECGINKTWLISWEAPEGEYDPMAIHAFSLPADERFPMPFSRCIAWSEQSDRFILGYCPDPRKPNAVRKLRAAVECYGVKVCGEMKLRMMYDNPDALDLYRFCGEYGLPVTLHFDNATAQQTGVEFPRRSWWYGGDIDTLERVLKLCPETNFLGHAPGFWCHISNDDLGVTDAYPTGPVIPGGKIERLLEKYPNLYLDTSAGSARTALMRDPAYTKKLMETFPDRFVYARDNFDNKLSPYIDSLGLKDEILEAFYHGNAERLTGTK